MTFVPSRVAAHFGRGGPLKKLVATVGIATALVVPTATAAESPTGSTARSASAFAIETVWQNIRGQYGRIWPKLHPRYRRVTTRARWEACQRVEAKKRSGMEWLSVRVTDEYADSIRLPLLGRIGVRAVSIEAKISHPLLGRRTIRDTVYVTKISGAWKGLWTPETYRAYATGRCPA